jgi:TonB family protein
MLAVAVAGAQTPSPPDPLGSVVALPMSPGAVALLLPHAGQPAAVERIGKALADPRPDVRAVAARVAFTTRHAGLAPALGSALAAETHPVAGAEMVRALSLILGARSDDAVAAALPRLDARARSAWIETLGRSRGAELFAQLAHLPDLPSVGRALGAVAAVQPDAAATAFAPLPTTPAILPAYLALVDAARRPHAELPPWPILAAGLSTPGRARVATLILLVDARASGRSLPPQADAALRDLASGDADLAAAHVYAELVTRRKKSGRSLAPHIGRIETRSVSGRFFYEPAFRNVTAEEAAAIARIVPGYTPPEGSGDARAEARPVVPIEEPGESLTRLPRPLSTALLKDLHRLTGCQPSPGRVALVDVRYRPTGQVRGVTLADRTTGDCAQLASILGALEVAPGFLPVADARVDRIVVGLRPSDLECEREPADMQVLPLRLDGPVTAPVKTRTVAPVYPRVAIERRLQGVVLIEAVVPRTGCVADAHVTRRLDPALDVAALAAVGEWRYTPGVLNGEPVPVVMAVTVNFTLQ